MRRSSTGAVAGVPDESRAPARASEFLGYEPTPGQRLVKSQFWAAWREDPSVDPASLTASDVGAYVDAPSIDKWWRDSGFRDWFLNKEEWRGKADAALQLWLDQTYRRLSSGRMSDKDLAAVGKLLAEIGGKLPKGGSVTQEAGKPKQLTEAEARARIEQAAMAMGWTPPPALTEPPVPEGGE